jgi:hypothetical protein
MESSMELTLAELYQVIGELEVLRRKQQQIITQLQQQEKHDDPSERPHPRPVEVA